MITIETDVEFVSNKTGYSAWLHVSGGVGDDYAQHCGFHKTHCKAAYTAQDAADDLSRVLRKAGVEAKTLVTCTA